MEEKQPFSLIDTRWQTHLKFCGRVPRTLEERAIAQANYEHANRLAEIKAMRQKLTLLGEFARPLWDRGVKLGDRTITRWMPDNKVLRIDAPLCSVDDKMYAAFLELGFREIDRKDWGHRADLVTLKQGRALLVAIEVSKRPAAKVQEDAPAAAPRLRIHEQLRSLTRTATASAAGSSSRTLPSWRTSAHQASRNPRPGNLSAPVSGLTRRRSSTWPTVSSASSTPTRAWNTRSLADLYQPSPRIHRTWTHSNESTPRCPRCTARACARRPAGRSR